MVTTGTRRSTLDKALWHIETRLTDESLTVDAVAAAVNVSPFHLARLFVARVGLPPVRYIRARRLSEAALTLARDGGRILDAALGQGFGSHEGFSRAFREQFGVTPDHVRGTGSTAGLTLVMPHTPAAHPVNLAVTPRLVSLPDTIVMGIERRYPNAVDTGTAGIARQWIELGAHWDVIPHKVGDIGLGVSHSFGAEGGFAYMAGAHVAHASVTPPLQVLFLRAQTYAVYRFTGSVADIPSFLTSVWTHRSSGDNHEPDAICLERYGEDFNPDTGFGVIDIYVPAASHAKSAGGRNRPGRTPR